MKDQNLFKQKLYHHTMPVPDNLWDRIESKLPAEKKRFPFFWFSLTAGVMLGGALLFLLATQKINQKENRTSQPATTIDAAAVSLKNNIAKNELTEIANNATKENSEILNPTTGEDVIPTASIPPHYRNTPSSGNTAKSGTALQNNQQHVLSAQESSESNLNITGQTHRNIDVTSFLPLSEISYTADRELNLKPLRKIKPDPNCYKFTGEDGVSRFSVDIFVGPGLSPRTFQDTGGETPLYAEARRFTEHHQYAFSAGARVNYYLRPGLAVSAGLIYEQVGDLFDYTDSLGFKRTLQLDSFFSSNGTFLYADTNWVLTFGTTIKKIHNRYHHIDVPFLLSYELPMGRATLMVNAGPVLNLTTSFRGQILDPALTPKHITPGAPNDIPVYKTNLGLSLYIGAGALIPLNENISALIEPRFLYRIKPVTLDSYPLKERRHFAGMNVGIRYHFN